MPPRRNRRRSGRKGFPSPAEQGVARAPASDLSAIDSHRFSWSFGSIDWDGPFGFRYIAPDDLAASLRLLSAVEHFSDKQLQGEGHHPIPVGRLSPLARARLVELWIDRTRPAVVELWSFRLTGAKRLWFVPRGRKHLALLWWDPHHRVYQPGGRQNAE